MTDSRLPQAIWSEEEIARLHRIESDLHFMANERLVESYGTPGPAGADIMRINARDKLIQLAMEIRAFRQAGTASEERK